MVPNTDNDLGFFTHSFFNNHNINCVNYHKYILPILNKLEVKAPIQVRANLSPSSFYKKDACAFHVDYEYKCKTAILYLNTCNGGTYIGKKFIKSVANRILLFDPSILHSSTNCTDEKARFNININWK